MDRWTNEWTNEWTDGPMSGRMNGPMEQIETLPRGDYSPVKRRSRQFTPEQTEAIAALQKVADASIVPTCTLGRGKANIFLDGNPIVYGGAVETVTMEPATGDPVIVVDHVGAVVAWGVFNADSMYRVRILQMAWEVDVTEAPNGKGKGVVCDVAAVISARVAAAAQLRTDLGVATDQTDVYRLVNSEGDRLSGVCVDVYGGGGGGEGGQKAGPPVYSHDTFFPARLKAA